MIQGQGTAGPDAETRASRRAQAASGVGSRLTSGLLGVVCAACLSALVVLSSMVAFTLIPALFGWQPDVILTGSMAPSIMAGDVVVSSPVQANQVMPGRVLLVNNPLHPGELLMHRVVSINEDGSIVTRGDANNANDSTPVPLSDVKGLPRLRVPMIGLPALWIRHGDWLPLLATVAGLLGAAWGASGVRTPGRRNGAATPGA